MANPGTYDIIARQSSDLNIIFLWKDNNGNPINLTGYLGAFMQVRQSFGSPQVFFDYNTNNSKLTLGGMTGTITLFDSGINTLGYAANFKGVYDLILVGPTDTRITILSGNFTVQQGVTLVPLP